MRPQNFFTVPFLTLFSTLLFFTHAAFADPYRDAFDRWDAALNNGLGYSDFNNFKGKLGWYESRIMIAYMTMYRTTKDIRYLKKLATHAEHVIAQRDDKKGRKDYRGISRPTWVATIYSENGQPAAWVAHSGMITYPMADFAYVVISDPKLWNESTPSGQSFIDMAHYLRDEVAKTIVAHDAEWDNEIGNYRFPIDRVVIDNGAPTPISGVFDSPGSVLPFNMYAAMGRTLLTMYLVTKKAEYRNKTIKLAKFFKRHLIKDTTGSYVWTYNPGGSGIEDMSHGSIEVDFAHLCFAQDIVFNRTDMERFATTFTQKICIEPMRFAECVNGYPDCSEDILGPGHAAMWANLIEFDGDIYQWLVDDYIEKVTNDSYRSVQGRDFSSLAELIYRQGMFSPIEVHRSPGSKSAWAGVAAGDFVKGGADEFVAVRNYDGNFYMYKYQDGSISQLASYTKPGSNSKWAGVAAGDFDKDGADEFVAVRNYDGNFYMYKYQNGAITQVASHTTPGSNSQWAGVAAGDFDNDGTDEFVAVRNYDGNLYMYKYQNGTITQIASHTAPGSNSQWAGVAAGDFDDDGTDEFVAVRNFDGGFYMYKYQDGKISQLTSYTGMGSNSAWMGITSGDFDGDGREEFAAIRDYDGDLYRYYLDGGVIKGSNKIRGFFPKNLQNGEISGGKLEATSQKQDNLIMLRNYDGDIFVFK